MNAASDCKPPWTLALGVLGASLLFFRGRLETSDELLMGLTAEAIATRASMTFAETFGQTSTGYGLGMPLLGVPLVWITGAVDAGASLLPLVNALALAVLAMLAAMVARALSDDSRTGQDAWVGALVLASPLLPASLTFYSDLVAATGLMAVIAACVAMPANDRRAWVTAGAGALIATMARPSIAPLILLVAGWSWRRQAVDGRVVAALLGLAAATSVSLWQNAVLRGSPFISGYVGQEFTTPLLTGLHGLLLSPERGLLVFFPALLLVFAPHHDDRSTAVRDYALLLGGVLVVALGVHAPFWTWHGGWTNGPRFLLPVVAVAVPLLAARLAAMQWDRGAWPLVALGLLACGAWGALVYSLFSAHRWWNEVWNFHQVESRWLFEPQLSLWQNVGYLIEQGRFEPVVAREVSVWSVVPGTGVAMILAAYLMAQRLSPVAAHDLDLPGGNVRGIAIEATIVGGAGPRLIFRSFVTAVARLPRNATLVMVATLLLIVGAWFLKGPRGWEPSADQARASYLVGGVEAPVAWSGLLDLPTHGTYTLHARLSGAWTITLDGTPLLTQAADEPRRLLAAPIVVDRRALRLVEIATSASPGDATLSQVGLYWSWPGEGRVLQPAGGEYVLPRELNALERAATTVWRRAPMLLAAALALALVLALGRRRRD